MPAEAEIRREGAPKADGRLKENVTKWIERSEKKHMASG